MDTKLDVRGAYNLFHVKAGDEHKLAFQTSYALFKPTVMQFGTTNGPADFQGYIIDASKEALDDVALGYLDDVLIYCDSEVEHFGRV